MYVNGFVLNQAQSIFLNLKNQHESIIVLVEANKDKFRLTKIGESGYLAYPYELNELALVKTSARAYRARKLIYNDELLPRNLYTKKGNEWDY